MQIEKRIKTLVDQLKLKQPNVSSIQVCNKFGQRVWGENDAKLQPGHIKHLYDSFAGQSITQDKRFEYIQLKRGDKSVILLSSKVTGSVFFIEYLAQGGDFAN